MKEIKLDGKSKNLVEQNIEKLKQMFPEIVTENKINFDTLQILLGANIDENKKEKYTFSWNGKDKSLKTATTQTTATLRPCKQESKNWDTTENIYIEGDNLEVLKLLQKSYQNKIKMIYIDPPYNTGNDFVYNDNFEDTIKQYKEITGQIDSEGNKITTNTETLGKYHTNWLNMMYPRLWLARQLLTDDGVIFISIDDNEQANLKKICDEIFGENNFITILHRKTVEHIRVLADYELQNLSDFVFLYTKNISNVLLNKKIVGKITYEYKDDMGEYTLKDFQNSGAAGTRTARPNLYYPIYVNPINFELSLQKKENYIEIVPKKVMNDDGRWLWSKEKFEKDKNLLIFKDNTIKKKFYFNPDEDQNKYEAYKNWLDNYQNRLGAKTMKDLELDGVFSYTKPVELILFLLLITSKKEDIILDFFSGSATTAHAVMQLNAEDSGNRKFIMVQLPELTYEIDKNGKKIPKKESKIAYEKGYKNLCEIGKERIRRAGEKIVKNTGKKDLDIGFKVFKLDYSNIKKWQLTRENIEQGLKQAELNFLDDRTNLDVVYEILLKCGLDLTLPIQEIKIKDYTIYVIANGAMVVCLDNEIDLDITDHILKIKQENNIESMITVFKDNGFINDSVKTNIKETLKAANIDVEKNFLTI